MPIQFLEDQLQAVKVPTPNDTLYKDECVFSFDTPESENGLYISLISFLSFGEDYLQLYFKKTKHAVFLHHKRTKKEIPKTEEEGPEKKITRLAIGVEGGFAADCGPKYEYSDTYRIVVLPDGASLPLSDPSLPSKIRESADAIIAAQSGFVKAEMEGMWDGENRQVSKHANNLVQLDNGKKIAASGWRCDKCNMSNNLWLNLTDGAILCGRQAFDGSGGNNHGVEHFLNTGYPLAVKLGTVTADGKADVFSYAEDDMVLDPLLHQHLAHFGIDIHQMQKTDKSMLELEIDLNQRVGEWMTCQESGSNLVPVYGPSRTGLVNLGNSCYLNSLMQVAFTLPSFTRAFIDTFQSRIENFDFRNNPAKDFILQMGKLGLGLASGKYSLPPAEGVSKEQPGISPRMFKHVVAEGNREFMSSSQQDAQEFFLHLINVIERKCRDMPNPANVFKMKVEDRLQCTESGKVMYMDRAEYCLPLPIPLDQAVNKEQVQEYEKRKAQDPKTEVVRPVIPMQACLDALMQPETLDKFYSTALKRQTKALKSARLATFPDYLMIHLKKFTAKDGVAVKMDVAVDVPDILDLEQLRGSGLKAGEEPLPDEEVPSVQLNMAVVNTLLEMGCMEEPAKKAVYYTDGAGVEDAYNWYAEHISDPDFAAPFIPPGSKPKSNAGAPVNEENVQQMTGIFGFSRQHAIRALRETDNNMERAADWAFSHPDEGEGPAVQEAQTPEYTDGPSRYRLRAFITHMGSSAQVGHYVCHILQDGQWLIFNDNKVALSVHPPRELAYLYLYERINK